MSLTDAQKLAVSTWIEGGKTLADVQQLLREEFSISMTYMDVRFLVDDLDIVFTEPADEASDADADADADAVDVAEIVEEGVPAGVSVEVDAIMRPGALVSGTVKFSDGVSLGWQLSGAGQLGLIPGDDPEYRPNPEDVQSFQSQLEEVLRKKGF
jgi:hypothetical protein